VLPRSAWRCCISSCLLLPGCGPGRGRLPACAGAQGDSACAGMGGVLAALAAALSLFLILRPLADRWMVVSDHESLAALAKICSRRRPWFDQAIEAGARGLVAAALANEADELVVIGHSGGELPLGRWWRAPSSSIRISAGGGRNWCC